MKNLSFQRRISLTIPNNTWQSAAFPYVKVPRKAARI